MCECVCEKFKADFEKGGLGSKKRAFGLFLLFFLNIYFGEVFTDRKTSWNMIDKIVGQTFFC